jgi:hypothetical protein
MFHICETQVIFLFCIVVKDGLQGIVCSSFIYAGEEIVTPKVSLVLFQAAWFLDPAKAAIVAMRLS